ncbi:MAG: DUF3786 domain-containing protein [Blautia sp.]|nr:DUF3786 domain-containing protein [Blautia sp.]MDY4516057.1 DUF3786 domain-containing protein [Lachnospiraceae bacterium]
MNTKEMIHPVDRYRDQLGKWQLRFQEEGRAIVEKHHRYPICEGRYLQIIYFYKKYLLDLQTGKLLEEDKSPCIQSEMSQMMIYSHLLYLQKGAYASGHVVSYEEIKGNSHVSGWAGKIRDRMSELKKALETEPEKVKAAVVGLGGELWNRGDVSFTLEAFEDVRFYYVFWKGDEEFPSDLRILYDENVMQFMHQESVVILGELGMKEVMSQIKTSALLHSQKTPRTV